jgi:hypothetical protein
MNLQTIPNLTDAHVEGANWAVNHSEFQDYSDLKMEAGIEAETRYGFAESLKGDQAQHSFVMGAMTVRAECCLRKGF